MSFDRTSDKELEDYLTTLTRRAGGCLSADAAGCLLGISQRAVDDRRQTKTLLAIPDAGGWAYPCAQFHGNRTIPGLAEVVQGLEVSGPWVTLEFLLTPDDALDGLTPREALVLDDEDMRERVMTLVRSFQGGEGFA